MIPLDSRNQSGFTLIEVTLVVIILTIVIAGALELYGRGATSWARGEKKLEVQDNLRIGVDRMARELRQAKRLTAGTTSNAASNDVLEFINYDNVVVRYEVSEHSLKRKAGSGYSDPLSNYIKEAGGLKVEYYPPGTGNQAAATQVKVILNGSDDLTGEYALSTRVRLRTHI